MSVLHHHLRDSGFHEGCVRQEKLVLLLTELDTRLAQRRETLQKRVTGPEDLLAAPVSQQTRITCPTPTSVEHANIRVKSYNLNSRERYVCNSGFKRKAGTSSLTECVFNKTMNIAHWTTPNLKCISAGQYRARAVTAAVSVLVAVLGAVCVGLLLVCYRRSRKIKLSQHKDYTILRA
ncbi:Interleukin-15 receptor subunit alpha [Camelus dromedarius]|uniref:Interleukin-15 receptor subunit alpha n=1 Tax=Camelus dromedarius TaxID=9838 RepID=A0A5N4C4Z3_CAMDR|nr:Interleukin-15 receptor subunit alpha [Camelus dromedarius]